MGNKSIGIFLWWLGSLMLILFLFWSCPTSLSSIYRMSYNVICMQLFVFWAIWVFISSKRKIDILEPIVLLTIIHLALFEITPIICLRTNDFLWFGIDVWGGCVKATWISTIAYIVICLTYYNSYYEEDDKSIEIEMFRPNDCIILNYCIWILAFLANAYLVITQGNSLMYMLTFGNEIGEIGSQSTSNMEFLSVIAYAMLPSYIYILHLSKSYIIRIVLYYLTVASFFIRGFRFIMVAIIIAPFVFWYLKKGERPKFFMILIMLIGLVVMIGVVGATRDNIRAGEGLTDSIFSAFSSEYLINILIDNFSIFKTYYGIVLNIPSNMPYTLGQQIILYTIIMFIPRAVWPNKPLPITRDVNSIAVSEYASSAGTAYPYIGEYYHEFGLIGVIICSFILGRLLRKLKSIMYERNIHLIVLYSAIYPLIIQIIIRGYTPSNFYMVLIVIIPIIITQYFDRRQESMT